MFDIAYRGIFNRRLEKSFLARLRARGRLKKAREGQTARPTTVAKSFGARGGRGVLKGHTTPWAFLQTVSSVVSGTISGNPVGPDSSPALVRIRRTYNSFLKDNIEIQSLNVDVTRFVTRNSAQLRSPVDPRVNCVPR